MRSIAVIGGGQAGSTVVSRLRALGCEDQLTLYCSEPTLPYERPPLSKAYLLGKMSDDDILIRPEQFYQGQNITVHLDAEITAINASRQTLEVNGAHIPYDALVLATGAKPIALPSEMGGDLGGLYAVRTLADVVALKPEFVSGRRLLVVGGGYVGLEAAAVARKLGLEVTVVERAERILQRVAAPQTSDFIRQMHRDHGVEILEQTSIVRLEGTGRVSRVHLSDGTTQEVDFVIVGIGVQPNTELAASAGLKVENGIATNEYCQTSNPQIWAVGDCAAFPYTLPSALSSNGDSSPSLIRLESVQNAIDQAACAAQNIMGKKVSYAPVPWFWSEQYDLKLQMAGLNTGYDNVVERRSGDAISFWYYCKGALISVDAMNDPRAYMVAKRLLEAGQSVRPEIVSDPDINLKTVLKR